MSLVATVCLAGCATALTGLGAGGPRPPLEGQFRQLARERGRVGSNDCSNKAGRYARLLVASGYRAEVVVVRPGTGPGLHAVVRTDTGLYCDPAHGRWTTDLARVGTPCFTIPVAKLDAWGPEFR